jgi:hypothetical protein
MKKIKVLLYVITMIGFFIACESERPITTVVNETVPDKQAAAKLATIDIDNNIVIEGETGDLFPSKNDIRTVLIAELGKAGVTADYSEIKIVRESTEEGEVVVLRAKDFENGVDTSVRLQSTTDGRFRLMPVEGTCSCKSKSCAESWGCNASGSGNTCSCSNCTGDCEKTSTSNFGSQLVAHLSNNID